MSWSEDVVTLSMQCDGDLNTLITKINIYFLFNINLELYGKIVKKKLKN